MQPHAMYFESADYTEIRIRDCETLWLNLACVRLGSLDLGCDLETSGLVAVRLFGDWTKPPGKPLPTQED